MVSNNKTKLGGINDRETGKLTRIDCPGDQATDPREVHRRGKGPHGDHEDEERVEPDGDA